MGDSLMTVVAVFVAVILMFLFPMLSVSERSDDISQLAVDTSVTSFVDNSRSVGKITAENFDKLINELNATGNTYDVEMEVKVLDENVGKKTTWTNHEVIGENTYYSVYTSQIKDQLNAPVSSGGGVYVMKEGDIFSCEIRNTNETLSQSLRSVFYSISSNDAAQIAAQHSGIVTATGDSTYRAHN